MENKKENNSTGNNRRKEQKPKVAASADKVKASAANIISKLKNDRPPDEAKTTPESNDMEVHHHPEVEKKGLKEYLLEGLMIFLAVTMGFFAESLREHIAEKNRANEFASTLYSDLKADTVDLKDYIDYTRKATANVDTLMQLLSVNDVTTVPAGKLYWFGLWGGAYRVFTPHDATLLEMKSSGSLRYFANPQINRQLAQYDQLCQTAKTNQSLDQGIYTEVRKSRAQLFDFKYNEVCNKISKFKSPEVQRAKIDSFIKTSPRLLNYDKVLFNEYVEMARSRTFSRKVDAAEVLLTHATALIDALKKEYKLDKE